MIAKRSTPESHLAVKRERDCYLAALRGIHGIATTPTQHFNEQTAARMIAQAIERIEGWEPREADEVWTDDDTGPMGF